jgi:hypothetical protein
MPDWRSRIVGLTHEPPATLTAHPANPKTHPPDQLTALAAALSELGWISGVLVNDRTGRIIDGHARVTDALADNQATVPVLHLDLDEAEELLALATFDPIGQMALMDADAHEVLLDAVDAREPRLIEFLANLRPPGPPAEFPAYDESVADGLVLRARWTLDFPSDDQDAVRAALEPLRAAVELKVTENTAPGER